MHLALVTVLLALGQTRPAAPAAAAGAPAAGDLVPGLPGIRNVLLIVVDTLRADHLSCYGYPRQTSPNIDRLARNSVLFRQCYTAWPETCQSMAAMLSGLYCQTNGVVVDTPQCISNDLEMLPETLAGAGLQTAAFIMNPMLKAANHYDQGFGDNFVECYDLEKHQGATETDLAREWLVDNGRKGPFFVWVHYIEPHAPYTPVAPDRFVGDAFYDPTRKVELHDSQYDAFRGLPGVSRVDGRNELDWYVAQYDGEIFDADRKIGSLLETLKQQKLDDSTLVIFTADHGEGLGEHDYFWHGLMPFDETAHVPLLMCAKGLTAATVPNAVSTIDIAPTILSTLGLPVPERYEGHDLLPALHDPARAPADRLIFTESGDEKYNRNWQRSVRDSRWKLVYVPSMTERSRLDLEEYALYDIAADPGEKENVLQDHADVAHRLTAELDGWIREDSLFHSTESDPSMMTEQERERARKLGYAVGDENGRHAAPPAADPSDATSAPAPKAAPTAPKERSFSQIDSVLLVVVDDLRADHMSCYGYPRATTPNLEQIAKVGLRFERAFAACPDVAASTAALLCGRFRRSTGASGEEVALPADVETLPELLRARGWKTAAFVHAPELSAERGFAQGFGEEFCRTSDTPKGIPPKSQTELALRWLETIGRGDKFLLVVHFDNLRPPWNPKGPDRFVGDDLASKDRDEVDRYDAAIAETDAGIGRLVRKLTQQQLEKHTAVIVVGTQGTALGEHGFRGDRNAPFDEAVRVPLLVRARGCGCLGTAIGDPASVVDLAPTMLEMLGLPPCPEHDGRSLAPLLRNPVNVKTRRSVFAESGSSGAGARQITLRNRSWKLVWTPDAADRTALALPEYTLFDLTGDPGETTNVADQRPDVLKTLRLSLQQWLNQTSARRAAAKPSSDAVRDHGSNTPTH